MCRFLHFMVAAVAITACVPPASRGNVPVVERPIAKGLTITLDEKGVHTDKDGTMRIAGRGGDAFRILATTSIERHPYPGEKLTAILSSGERIVKQAPFTFDAVHGRAKLDVPAPGTYRLEIWANDRFIVGNTFVAASLPTLDGHRMFELHEQAGPQLLLTEQLTGQLTWQHWDTLETDSAFVAEWWLDGKKQSAAGSKRSDFQRETLRQVQIADQVDALGDQTAWRWTTENFNLPDVLRDVPVKPGHWELRVYRDDREPIALGFDVTYDGKVHGAQKLATRTGGIEVELTSAPASKEATKALAKLPRARFEPSKRFLLAVTVPEVRALTRSEVLRGMRSQLNNLQKQSGGGETALQFGGKDESPAGVEARKLVTAMQKMILALGEPWTNAERP